MSAGTRFETLFKDRVAVALRRERATVLARTLAVGGMAVVVAALALRSRGVVSDRESIILCGLYEFVRGLRLMKGLEINR